LLTIVCDIFKFALIPVACPLKGQVRRVCAPHPNCMSSCLQEVSTCTEFCSINGCGCPISKVLNNHHNECVSPSECPGKGCDVVINLIYLENTNISCCTEMYIPAPYVLPSRIDGIFFNFPAAVQGKISYSCQISIWLTTTMIRYGSMIFYIQ